MIEGVKVKRLKVISDERGRLMEILRGDEEIFKSFGQVYMTTARPGASSSKNDHRLPALRPARPGQQHRRRRVLLPWLRSRL